MISYIKLNQIKKVKWFLSRELNRDNNIESQVEHLSNRFNDNKYQLINEYYLVNKYIVADTVKSAGTGINIYSRTFTQPAQEMYI